MSVEFCTQALPVSVAHPQKWLYILIPPACQEAVKHLRERSAEKHNNYLRIRLDLPFRPRTFGPKRQKPTDPGYQANHLNGHLSQLAIHYGYTKNEMKEIMKDDVPEWPQESRKIGRRVKVRPVSEADVSIEVEGKAIEWCHMIAGEEGIVLVESKWEMEHNPASTYQARQAEEDLNA